MKKKIMLLVAIMALFVCGGAFAAPPMYVGVELGYGSIDSDPIYGSMFSHFDAFELAPVFGIAPFSKLPDLALEFNFMMDFAKSTYRYETIDDKGEPTTKTIALNANIFSPQILAVYTFFDGPVRPFIGAGIGMNFNTGKIDSEIPSSSTEDSYGNVSETSIKADDIKVKASFSLVSKVGVVASIPNTKFDLIFLGRYNVNISSSLSYVPVSEREEGEFRGERQTIYGPFNFSNLSFSAGARFNF